MPGSTVPPALTEFVRLFNSGAYWESHEVLEAPWRENRSDFYHGLILLASALVHRQRSNDHGVLAQLDKAEPILRGFRPHYLGIDIDKTLELAAGLRAGSDSTGTSLRLDLDLKLVRGDEPEDFRP